MAQHEEAVRVQEMEMTRLHAQKERERLKEQERRRREAVSCEHFILLAIHFYKLHTFFILLNTHFFYHKPAHLKYLKYTFFFCLCMIYLFFRRQIRLI